MGIQYDVIIRKAENEDIVSMTRLLEELFSLEEDFQYDPERQQQGLGMLLENHESMVAVAESGGEIVAMCTVQRLISTAQGGYVGLLEDVVVKTGHRGKGIGRQMIAYAKQYAEEQGMTRLQLLADRNNHPALLFYSRHGWEKTRLVALRQLL